MALSKLDLPVPTGPKAETTYDVSPAVSNIFQNGKKKVVDLCVIIRSHLNVVQEKDSLFLLHIETDFVPEKK